MTSERWEHFHHGADIGVRAHLAWPTGHELAGRGILIRSPSARGVAEEVPGTYKDVSAVVEAADHAHLARMVARLEPLICVKG